VGLEGLLTELLVAAGLHGVQLETVGVGIDEMVLGEEVRHWVEGGDDAEGHHEHDLGVWHLGATQVVDVLGDVVGHLWGGGWGAVVVLDHTVVQLWGHGDNHVIVVWVEVTTLWHIETEWWRVVVASQQVVWVVDETWLHETSLGQIWWPHTLVGVLGLMDSHVGWPDSVIDLSLTEVPLLEVVRAVLLMTWVHLWQVDHLGSQLNLSETFVDEQIVLLVHSAVAALASTGEHLETSSQSGGVEGVPGDLTWEVVVTVVHTNGVNLLFVTLDTVWGTDVVTEEPSLVGHSVTRKLVSSTASQERGADRGEISVD
jgi:hypothetical protein